MSTETIKVGDKTIPEVVDNHPNRGTKLDYINKQDWGLDKKVNQIRIKGNRYMFGG